MAPAAPCSRRDIEAALSDAAERVLVRDGPDAVTVRAVAAEAGVAPMGVYNRFGGKDGLVDELLSRGFIGLREAIDRRISHTEYFPVALALSGGIDSTIIAALATGHLPGRVVAVTIGGALDVVDATTARQVAARLCLTSTFDQVSAGFLLEHYLRIVLACGAHRYA